MNKKSIILSVAALGALVSPAIAKTKQSQQPNILFILADDYGWKDMSCAGSNYYETPNLDQLAAEGVRFTHAYAACSVCSPSRATIMTGQYPPRHDITNYIGAAAGEGWRKTNRFSKLLPPDYAHQLPSNSITIARVLHENGYKTFFAGKWHLGGQGSYPEDHGFDINKGGYEAGSPAKGYFSPYHNPKLTDGPAGEDLSIRLAKETAGFIKEQATKNKNQPFLAYLSFYAVHAPIQTTQAKWRYFRDKAEKQTIANSGFIFDRTLPVRQVQDNPVYAGLVQQMDDAVGIVLNQLKALGLDKNTLVIFTSDNGGVSSGDAFSTSNLPLRGGKGRQWEGGTRVPLIIRCPGAAQNRTSEVPVMGIDYFPTILEFAGLSGKTPKTYDGVNILPLLKDQKIENRLLYWHYPHYGNQGGEPSSTILDGDWKLICYHEDDRNELYNLKIDETESEPLNAQYPEKVKDLRSKLDRWLLDLKAKMPVADPLYDPIKEHQFKERNRTITLQNVEITRLLMLSNDYQPNKDWWGSITTND